MFRRSSRGLTKKYREEYNSVNTAKRYASRKKKPSFEGFIKEQYNTTLGILKNEFSKYNNSQLTKDELKLKRRVMTSSKIKSVSDVSKNISRAVKRLDIVRDSVGNIVNLNTSYDKDSPSSIKNIRARIGIKKRFMESDTTIEPLKKIMETASAEDLQIMFDFLNKMKKLHGNHLDEYYQFLMEDFYDMIQQERQKGQTIDYISFDRLQAQINIFKISNQKRYNLDNTFVEQLIKDTWTKYRGVLKSNEEDFIKDLAKYKKFNIKF